MGGSNLVISTDSPSGGQNDAIKSASARLHHYLRQASRNSGVSFSYLVKTAKRESNFNPLAKASTTSASGLFQFIEQTWLEVMHQEGARFGYHRQANAIAKVKGGGYSVGDRAMKEQVLKLRLNPQVASNMAAALAKNNSDYLSSHLGRKPTQGELYAAHFLGGAGALRLISHNQIKPNLMAMDIFPAAAKANPAIFSDKGQPLSIKQVYRKLTNAHDSLSIERLTKSPNKFCQSNQCFTWHWPGKWLSAFSPQESAKQTQQFVLPFSGDAFNPSASRSRFVTNSYNKGFNLFAEDNAKGSTQMTTTDNTARDGEPGSPDRPTRKMSTNYQILPQPRPFMP